MADGKVVIDTELDQSGAKKGMSKLSGALSKAGSVAAKGVGVALAGTAAAAGTAATAVAGLVSKSVQAYADYEQLTGGVETLFKTSADKLMGYAEQAYMTTGMSANEYMENVTSFSASLISSLGGDTEAAADYANDALVAMSDNVNKMGSSMESVSHAYQGFAKGQFNMLDNLKLGYGGTKEEMERLLADAEKISGVEYDVDSFADITKAIQVIQDNLGITGTTAKEASTTISGSLTMTKKSFQDLITGMSNEDADMSTLMDNFADSFSIFLENVTPKIQEAASGLAGMAEYLLPLLVETVASVSMQLIPVLVESVVNLVKTVVGMISKNTQTLVDGVIDVAMTLVDAILSLMPVILETGLQIIIALAEGLAEVAPELIPEIVQVLMDMILILLENIPLIIDAGIQLLMGLVDGIIQALPILIENIPLIIDGLINALLSAIPQIITAGIQLFLGIIGALPEIVIQLAQAIPTIITSLILAIMDYIPIMIDAGIQIFTALTSDMPHIIIELVKAVPEIIKAIVNGFKASGGKIKEVGKNLISGIWEGMKNAGNWLKEKVKGLCSGVVDGMKGFFGIHSPSTLMRDEIGKFLAEGIGVGFEENNPMDQIIADLNNGMLALQSSIKFDFDTNADAQAQAGITQYITIEKEVNSPDEMARAIRLESKYGLMRGEFA